MGKKTVLILVMAFVLTALPSCGEALSSPGEAPEPDPQPFSGAELAEEIQSVVYEIASRENAPPSITIDAMVRPERTATSIEGEAELERFFEWLGGLELELLTFEPGEETPGHANGGVCYWFTAGNENADLLSYRLHCIFYSGNWYRMTNEPYPYWRAFDPWYRGFTP
jgi:hypothetical protein